MNRMFMDQADKKVKRYTQFTTVMPPASVVEHLTAQLVALHCGDPDKLQADAADQTPPRVDDKTCVRRCSFPVIS